MRPLMRNGCLLAAVIFIPSSLSNGTAALVMPLNSSDCWEERAANGKVSSVLQAKPSHLLSLTFLCFFHTPWEPSIIPSQDCLLQGDSFTLNGFMLHTQKHQVFSTKPSIKNSWGKGVGEGVSAKQNYLIICTNQTLSYVFPILLCSHLRLLKNSCDNLNFFKMPSHV